MISTGATGTFDSRDIDKILTGLDPLETLPMDLLEPALAKIVPYKEQLLPVQKHQVALLEARYQAIRGEYKSALTQLQWLEQQPDLNPEYRIRSYDLALQINTILGDYIEAYTFLNKINKLLPWSSLPRQKYRALAAGTELFTLAGDYQRALEHAKQSLAWAEEMNSNADLCTAWSYVADVHLVMESADQAEIAYKKQLEYAGYAGLTLLEGVANNGLGSVALIRGDGEEALQYFIRGKQQLLRVDYVNGGSSSDLGMARSYHAMGRMSEAQVILDSLVPKLESAEHWRDLVTVYGVFAEIKKSQGDFKAALAYLEKKGTAEHKLLNKQKNITLALQQVEFETQAKDQEISVLQQETVLLQLQQQSDEQQLQIRLLALIAGLAVASLLIILLFRVYRERTHFKHLSQVDGLTNLYNHKSTYAFAEEAFRRCHGEEKSFTVLIGDIDKFKKINDTHGHNAGDEVLKALCDAFRQVFGATAIIGRTGGDEFSLFFSQMSVEQVLELVAVFNTSLQPVSVYGTSIEYTLSFGAAQEVPEDRTMDMVVRKADEALYEAKRRGRNHVVEYDPSRAEYWQQQRV